MSLRLGLSVQSCPLDPGETGLFPAVARSGSVLWLPHGRKEAGLRTLSFAPTATERGTYCSGVPFMAGADLDAPRPQTVPAAV
jgi:hypothetical protein